MCDHGNEQYPPEEEKRDEPVDGDLRLPAGQPLLVVQTQLRSLRKGVVGHGGRAGGHHRHDRWYCRRTVSPLGWDGLVAAWRGRERQQHGGRLYAIAALTRCVWPIEAAFTNNASILVPEYVRIA